MPDVSALIQLGWKPYYQQQLTLEEWESATMGRVISQERGVIHVQTSEGRRSIHISKGMPAFAVGDWVVLDASGKFIRLLERLSLFSRKAAGTKVSTQLIASNIDTVFIVSSMNQDFNLNRIERYLALANEAGVEPVIILTKLDTCEDPDQYIEQINAMDRFLETVAVNSLDSDSVRKLDAWCAEGKTLAFLGSSGVGKSTLINTLLGEHVQHTSSIREDDAKGRHATTSRSIHMLPSGGLLLDTPGMRELQLAGCEQGVDETFREIGELAGQCRFKNCQHENEPGCAVRAAIESGDLDGRRLANYLKLMKEQELNAATLAEKRAKEREFGRYIHAYKKSKSGKK
ncbi:ribosome biogenesis GTPase [Mariprofundus ferrinatatus]|uniref:Small ribosomal subunit biogenesis GTPase RsgA n=1 Tax=Mariprofundus ferrinatatus TaxID=1921087 RepID=A0A2K8L528_9PROT|nr:ribosome small subunit-dependent GTPase A [Mariprofundus ferrinatatus]ATX82420.1 ribosome biogenesis GTPase [Mariprofundus ferrinatatus]